MLVIEGSDGLGKSTFAKALSQKIGELAGCEGPEIKALTHEDSAITCGQYCSMCNPWVIYDRFHISECTYGAAVKGREPNISNTQAGIIQGAITAAGGFTVVIYAQEGTYRSVVDAGGWSDDRQLFDKAICGQVDYLYGIIGRNSDDPGLVGVRVTSNRTRKGPDWPASRMQLIEDMAKNYIRYQKALGHGLPPSAEDYTKERGLQYAFAKGVAAINDARKQLVAGVMAAIVSSGGKDPLDYELEETGGQTADGGYTRSWSVKLKESDKA